jgi:hypothetical protein
VAVAAQIGVVLECCPGDWIMTVTKTEAAKAHDRVSDATGELLDEQVINLSNGLIASPIVWCPEHPHLI